MKKTIAFICAIPTLVVIGAGLAGATPPTAESAVTAGAESVQEQLLAIGFAVLPLGAGVLALTMGWRFAKRFLRG